MTFAASHDIATDVRLRSISLYAEVFMGLCGLKRSKHPEVTCREVGKMQGTGGAVLTRK
jgi:hypothetical protein